MLDRSIELGVFDDLTGEVRVKQASLEQLQKVAEIADFIRDFKPDPKFLYLHVIAMGAGEYYGCNKNGDFFPEDSLKARHKTFEQQAKVFKEHNNKPNSPDYGFVPIAWYNEAMHRVELVLAIDREKGSDIVADVESGKQIEVSMGCRIPHDVCSICGNKAAKKNEYCDHIKFENKKVYADGRQVFMYNYLPTFYDISVVARRADRIAYALGKVASSGGYGNLDHIRDCGEEDLTKYASFEDYCFGKRATIDKTIPAMAEAQLLNHGMNEILPKLEQTEPDIPVHMLDRIATRFSLGDILTTFLRSMVPMKPREFARVIVVNQGYPLNWYDGILQGIMGAPRDIGCEQFPGLMGGQFHSEIPELLGPILPMRSSYGPHVQDRVLRLVIGGRPKFANYVDPNEFGMGSMPLGHPGYMQYAPTHKVQPYGTLPVTYHPEEYAMRQRAPLESSMNPLKVGLALGAMYAASRSVSSIGKLVQMLTSDKALGTAAALTGIVGLTKFIATPGSTYNHTKQAAEDIVTENGVKTAGFMTNYVAPFVGAHFASAHYRRKYMEGEDLSKTQRFIAENPDFLSIAAPITLAYGRRKLRGVDLKKNFEEFVNKTASFGDVLADSAVQGIIFHGRGTSGIGAMGDMVVDNALMRHGSEMATGTAKPMISAKAIKDKVDSLFAKKVKPPQ